jgi:tight adherence protein B
MLSTIIAATVAAASAMAPGLTVTALRQEAGFVEFYLSGVELPAGTDFSKVTVSIAGDPMETKAEPVSAGTVTAPKRAVVLVLDTSGSMFGTPLADARSAALAFTNRIPPDVAIGVVTAGAPAKLVQPLTTDRGAVTKAVSGLTAQGETAIYDAVIQASSMMSVGDWGQRRIVLLTDGADTASKATVQSARDAIAKIPLDTIAYHTPDTTVTILNGLATSSGGQVFAAADSTALGNAFNRSAGSFSAQLLVRVTIPPALSGQQATLKVSAGGVSTDIPLQLAVDTRPSGPLVGTKADQPGIGSLLLIGGLVFAFMLVAAALVVSPMFSAAQRRKRLAQVEQFTAAPAKRAGAVPAEPSSQVAQAALALSAQVMKSTHTEGRLAQQLDRAGMRLRPHEWLLLRGIISLGLGLLLGFSIDPIGGLLLGGVIGIVATSLYHRNRATKRMNLFNELLPDALQVVIGALRAGFSLSQALDAMVRELPDPISGEFGRALGETRLGVEIEDALDRLAARMRNKDLAWAVVAIRVQREVGGNLAEVLTNTVSTIRERESLRRHVRALSAEGRLSAWVLLALPVFITGFMLIFRPAYLRPLYTHPIGIAMSLIGILLVAVGGLWLSRLVKVEV